MEDTVSAPEEIIRKGYGRWLRRQRSDRAGGKLTQQELAAGIEREKRLISDIERGRATMTEDTFVAILKLFGITPSEAFGELLPIIKKAESEHYQRPDRGRGRSDIIRTPRPGTGASDRSLDWWKQALRDLEHGESSLRAGYFDWAAFAAHQAAEKAARSLIPAPTPMALDHSIIRLLRELPGHIELPDDVATAAVELGRHYAAARYPDALPTGYPGELYRERGASAAMAQARRIVEFCRSLLPLYPEPTA